MKPMKLTVMCMGFAVAVFGIWSVTQVTDDSVVVATQAVAASPAASPIMNPVTPPRVSDDPVDAKPIPAFVERGLAWLAAAQFENGGGVPARTLTRTFEIQTVSRSILRQLRFLRWHC